MERLEMLNRRIERERNARKHAEAILEEKALELYKANEQLRQLNETLENELGQRINELYISENRYREVIESAQDIIYTISPTGHFTFVNSYVESILGYSESEIIGKFFIEIIEHSHRKNLIDFYTAMVQQKQKSTYSEFPVLHKNGTVVWVGQTVRLIQHEDKIIELVAVARDITKTKLVQENLLTTQARLTTLITNFQQGMLVEDENRRIILVNQLFCDIFNIPAPPQALIGMDCSQSAEQSKYLFQNPDQFVIRIEEVLREQKNVIDEELPMIDGRTLKRDYIPIFLDNKYQGHLWNYKDITEDFNIRERIRKSEEKYRGIMNNMELGLLEVDNDQIIIRAYDRFCELLGYTEDELIGKCAPDLFLPKDFAEVLEINQAKRATGAASSYELQLVRKDGAKIWVLISGAPILDEHGNVVGSMGIHYDITARKRLEQELAQANMRAEKARQAEKQFLANMSHEIRTPLNAIIGMSHLMFDTRPTKQQLEYIEILKTSADFLHSLISDILDMAKIEAGRIEVQKHSFDLVGLLRSTQRMFQLKLQNRPIELDLMIDARISGNYSGDDLLLNQILHNLIGNAEKFTENGSINITAKVKKEENDIIWIEFKIADTGVGISQDKLELIFQKFKQVNLQGHKHKGSGLGLAITKQLVELQGGTITVKSQEGEGSTFTVLIPYQKIESEMFSETLEIHPASPSLEGSKILVVEDNLMNQKYISSLLTKWKIDFMIASDGIEAVNEVKKQLFDIILMDIQMPNMDGYEATIKIRNTKNLNQNTPIIALTASAMLDKKNKTKMVGMDDFITKPFAPNQLLNVLNQYIKIVNWPEHHQALNTTKASLDRKRLQELYGNDKEYAADMFKTFLSDVLPDFAHLQSLLNQQDWASLSKLAHKLKPTLGMVGLTDLESKMLHLETNVTQNPDSESLQGLLNTVQEELEDNILILKKELETLIST